MATIDGCIVGAGGSSTKGHDDAGNILSPPTDRSDGPGGVAADGRMMAVLCDGRATLPPNEPRQFMSYAGNYTFDGETLSTRVDASSDASRIGGDQVRSVRFENGDLVLAPPRRLYAGIMQHQELVWERLV
jgi:hypothetical protein